MSLQGTREICIDDFFAPGKYQMAKQSAGELPWTLEDGIAL